MDCKKFIDILNNNDEDEIRDYVISKGKKPKPVSPIYYISDLTEEQAEIYNISEFMERRF